MIGGRPARAARVKGRVFAAAVALLASACTDGNPGDAGTDSGLDGDVADAPFAACTDGRVTIDPDDAAGACAITGRDESQCADLLLGDGRDGAFEDFRAFQPGDVVWIDIGSQGLQHILVALRGSGFVPTNPLVSLRFVVADNCESVGRIRFRLPFSPDAGTPSAPLALQTQRVILLDDHDPLQYCDAMDRDVVLVADLDDLQGHRAHREMRLHVGGIDPMARPDLRQAWIDACANRDGGREAGVDASLDASPEGGIDP